MPICIAHASFIWPVKDTTKGRFCGAEAFIRNKNAANRLTASWSAIKKEENEKNVPNPEVRSEFSLRGRRVVEWNVLAEADWGWLHKKTLSGLGSLLYICCSNSECGETNICRTNKTHRSTGTTRGRPIFDVNTKLAAGLFTFLMLLKILLSTIKACI